MGTQSKPDDTIDPWHNLQAREALERLQVDPKAGLSAAEATRRLQQHGPNSMKERPGPGALRRFLRQFTDVTVLSLLAAAIIAVVMGILEKDAASFLEQYGDAAAIMTIVLLNAVIGFAQEAKAETALKSLMDITSPTARVIRDGRTQKLVASDIAPGDVVLIEHGDRIPVDVRLVDTAQFSVSEAALTGESTPVEKDAQKTFPAETPVADRKNMAFMGTHAASGRAVGVATATGMDTELGAIAAMLGAVKRPETPLQEKLKRFGLYIVIACVVVAAVVFGVGLIRLNASFRFLLLTAVSLAVAAIPEGLPAITTIVLAMGVQRMAKKHALVRRLSSVETLGSAQVICTDKTGTLTQNRMAVRRIWTTQGDRTVSGDFHDVKDRGIQLVNEQGRPIVPLFDGRDPTGELIAACALAPGAKLETVEGKVTLTGDPTDGALLMLHQAHADSPRERPEVVEEYPFDADRKMGTVRVRTASGGIAAHTHGSTEAVLAACTRITGPDGETRDLSDETRQDIGRIMERWGEETLRVLALARRDLPSGETSPSRVESDMTLLGLVGIADPPRPEVIPAIEKARRAGVRTVMITGDHPKTGAAVAREIGILTGTGKVVTGAELDRLSEDELRDTAPTVEVVARATAANKLRFVQALMQKGQVVAMTGDGVNDAPALKAASIGVAMGQSGTDVAREASDLVLADDNYATIVSAIEEGRAIFSNIKRFIIFLLSVNSGLVFAVFVAALLGWPPILTPTQILWINLITNGLPALALGMEPVHTDPMRLPPRRPDAGLVDLNEVIWLGGYGLFMGAVALFVFYWFGPSRPGAAGTALSIDTARTLTFTVLAMAPLFHGLNCRSLEFSVFRLGFFGNGRLWVAFALALALQAVAIYVPWARPVFKTVPLSWVHVAWALGFSMSVWLVGEAQKATFRAFARPA